MSWPHDLFHFRDVVMLFKDDHVVCLTSRWVLITMIDDHCDGNHAWCHHIVLLTPSLWLPELYSPLRLYGGAHCQRRRRGQWGASQGWGTKPLPSSSPLSSLSFSTSTIISMIISVTTMLKRPVTAHGEGNSVQHVVDWIHHLFSSDGELDMIWWE